MSSAKSAASHGETARILGKVDSSEFLEALVDLANGAKVDAASDEQTSRSMNSEEGGQYAQLRIIIDHCKSLYRATDARVNRGGPDGDRPRSTTSVTKLVRRLSQRKSDWSRRVTSELIVAVKPFVKVLSENEAEQKPGVETESEGERKSGSETKSESERKSGLETGDEVISGIGRDAVSKNVVREIEIYNRFAFTCIRRAKLYSFANGGKVDTPMWLAVSMLSHTAYDMSRFLPAEALDTEVRLIMRSQLNYSVALANLGRYYCFGSA